MPPKTIAIIGGLDYDLIMIANRIPDQGESLLANEYLEALGGKGASSAIATYRTCHRKPIEGREPEGGKSDDVAILTGTAETLSAPEQLINNPGYKDDIQVRMVGAIGDDHAKHALEHLLCDGGELHAGCLFTLGTTAAWRKEHFLKVENLVNGIRPDLVVAQMEIDKEVVEQMIETAGNAGIDFCLNAAPANPVTKRTYRYITHLLVKVIDTTGAGDTFTGADASEYLRQKTAGAWDIRSAVVRANKAAAITIMKMGAQAGIPWQ